MPALIPRACRKRGCPGTTTDRSGYCEQHRNEGWQQHQQGKSRHERGYGGKWDIKAAVADDDCAVRFVPSGAVKRLHDYANGLRSSSGGSVTSQPDG